MRSRIARSAGIAVALCVCGFADVPAAHADITCNPNVQHPHKSTHVPGTVNVVVTVTCTAPVTEIRITAGLYRDGSLISQSPITPFSFTSFAQANAATSCQDGTYQGWMDYDVTWPPDYEEVAPPGPGYGAAVSITCGDDPPPPDCEAPGDPSMTCRTSAPGEGIEAVDNATTAAPATATASERE